MKRSICAWAPARVAWLSLAFVFSCGAGFSQQSLETNYRMTGAGVLDVFEPQRQVIQKFSAVFYEGRKEVAYGVVISADGYILSKASEIEEISALSVRVDRESFKDVKVVLVDPRWDVALVKIDAEGLLPVAFADSSDLPQGTWVVVNGATSRTKRRVLAGIVSAERREIPAEGGAVMGVQLEKAEGRIQIGKVSEGSGADKAGLKEGDVISIVDGKEMKESSELMEYLKDKKAGDVLEISVKRGDEVLELEVSLSARGEVFAQTTRNDQMSGDYSKRRSGFPRVLQHDILANSDTMGGPVLDLAGKVVGMNIARANRAETFAIPVEELRDIAKNMVAEVSK
ncbi:MAG: PDZ domain-containing protein [Verrucomicrobia bacterium]|nr:PDZ domain-containing protein [Verrucomicrobiota bacterium]